MYFPSLDRRRTVTGAAVWVDHVLNALR